MCSCARIEGGRRDRIGGSFGSTFASLELEDAMRRLPAARSLAILVLSLSVGGALGACDGETALPGPGDGAVKVDLGGRLDAGGATDLASVDLGPSRCEQIDECTCLAMSSCRAVTETCYCPYPKCGSGECKCGGGRFFGCAEPGCAGQLDCSRAATITRDGKRCPTCVEPTDCAGGIAALKKGCGISEALLSAFRCDGNVACKLDCIKKVRRCEDVGCGLCAVCGCGVVGAFEKCVFACGS